MGGGKAGEGDNRSSPGFQLRFTCLREERTGITIASSFLWYFQSQPAAGPQRPMQQPCCWRSSPTTFRHPHPIRHVSSHLPYYSQNPTSIIVQPCLFDFLAPTWLCSLLRDLSKNQLREGILSYPIIPQNF